MIKKIIITITLIVFLLFIQSYVFSEVCSINTPFELTKVDLGCTTADECYFTFFNSTDKTSAFIDAESVCKTNYIIGNYYETYEQYRDCIEQAITSYIPSPSKIFYYSDLVFTKQSSCTNQKINLVLNVDLNFEMKNNTKDITLSGVDTLNTNNHDIDIFVNNNNKLGSATFDLDVPIVNISGTSLINMVSKTRFVCSSGFDDYIHDHITFKFKQLNVFKNSKLNFNMNIPQTFCAELNLPYTPYSGSIYFNGNTLINNGVLDLTLKSQNSQNGQVPYMCNGQKGSDANPAGNIFFILDNLDNNGNFDLNLIAGNGGFGGDGSYAGRTSCTVYWSHHPGPGGFGGAGGNIIFYINKILNNNNFNVNLLAGNGGKGANTGFDGGRASDYAKGGDGGAGGSIFFCQVGWSSDGFDCINPQYEFSQINNNGIFNFNAFTGKGNNGGSKNNHYEVGEVGNGGNGGSYNSNFKVDILKNTNIFNLNLEANKAGLKGVVGNNGVDGIPGYTQNIFIDYLINKSKKLQLILNSKKNVSANTSDLKINVLENGSYLPSKVSTISTLTEDNNSIISTTNRAININSGCYIKNPNSNFDYNTGKININSANKEDFSSFISQSIPSVFSLNEECSLCDYYDLTDEIMPVSTELKFSKTYSLYSNNEGIINANDLNIYYAKNNINFNKFINYNPFLKKELPVYTNKFIIIGELNPKLGIYEYKIEPANLKWYYDPLMNLSEKDIYCYYQNYRLVGTITSDTGNKSFDFPFTPIFK